MSPEERAKALLAKIVERGTGGWRFADEVEDCAPLIATAIREACNEKLEEAALAVDLLEIPVEKYRLGRTYWSVHVDTLDEASTVVRALKDTTP